jgi:hypothetical protein
MIRQGPAQFTEGIRGAEKKAGGGERRSDGTKRHRIEKFYTKVFVFDVVAASNESSSLSSCDLIGDRPISVPSWVMADFSTLIRTLLVRS